MNGARVQVFGARARRVRQGQCVRNPLQVICRRHGGRRCRSPIRNNEVTADSIAVGCHYHAATRPLITACRRSDVCQFQPVGAVPAVAPGQSRTARAARSGSCGWRFSRPTAGWSISVAPSGAGPGPTQAGRSARSRSASREAHACQRSANPDGRDSRTRPVRTLRHDAGTPGLAADAVRRHLQRPAHRAPNRTRPTAAGDAGPTAGCPRRRRRHAAICCPSPT